MRPVNAPTVAVDVGSTLGPRTGVGQFVTRLLDGLAGLDEPPRIKPYVLSFRATLPHGVQRLAFPARVTLQAWARTDHPRGDRGLGGADVVHGPNYVVPPSRGCRAWCRSMTAGSSTTPTRSPRWCGRSAPVCVAPSAGATVHIPSEHTADQVRRSARHGARRRRPARRPDDPARAGVRSPGRPRGPALHPRPRGQGAAQEPSPPGRRRSACCSVRSPISRSCCSARRSGTRPPSTMRSGGRSPRPRTASSSSTASPTRSATVVAGAAALAYPSLDEGFGFPALEAMAAAVPVVAADAGSIPEICGEAAILRRPPQPDGDGRRAPAGPERRGGAGATDRRGHERGALLGRPLAAGMAALYRALAMGGAMEGALGSPSVSEQTRTVVPGSITVLCGRRRRGPAARGPWRR